MSARTHAETHLEIAQTAYKMKTGEIKPVATYSLENFAEELTGKSK